MKRITVGDLIRRSLQKKTNEEVWLKVGESFFPVSGFFESEDGNLGLIACPTMVAIAQKLSDKKKG